MATDDSVIRCAFCRLPCSAETVSVEYEGEEYECCSIACREAMVDSETVFTGSDDDRRLRPGVAGLDASLPQGLPRNSFVMLVGHPGTREEAIGAELVWRTLQRGEPAVVVAFTEPPTSVVENFLALEWNVFPYLEAGTLEILDCFTYRMDDRDRLFDRMTAWNRHIRGVTEPQTTAVRDPSDGLEIRNALDNCLESLEMVEEGLVVIDSIAEFGSLVQPVQAYDFVKDVRAEVCKGRFVPIVAGGTIVGEKNEFPRDLEYIADGVIELVLDGSVLEDTLFRRLRVRKMRGVLAISEWHTFEYTGGLGQVTFDPLEELEASAEGESTDDAGEGESTDDTEEGESTDDAEEGEPSGVTSEGSDPSQE